MVDYSRLMGKDEAVTLAALIRWCFSILCSVPSSRQMMYSGLTDCLMETAGLGLPTIVATSPRKNTICYKDLIWR